MLIYASIGFVAARSVGVAAAATVGSAFGFVEATLGWAISWLIGPGRMPSGTPSLGRIADTVLIVTLIGAAIGALGGIIGKRSGRRGIPASERSADIAKRFQDDDDGAALPLSARTLAWAPPA